jgi:dienelactone hydrolase
MPSILLMSQAVQIPSAGLLLDGELNLPAEAPGLALFAHGSGSSRHSPRNQFVARTIREAGIGTLLFDLLTRDEEVEELESGHLRFNIDLLSQRLGDATRWIAGRSDTCRLGLGYFGASTGAAAALAAAAEIGPAIDAVVSRGGRPDLAGDALARVQAPTLLIVGSLDQVVLGLNQQALARLRCEKKLVVVPGASHLFEEPGTLDRVAQLAAEWFRLHLRPR